MPSGNALPTREDLIAQLQDLAAPVDFELLERHGLIRKAGAWYEVPNAQKLPKHASAKITATASRGGRTFVKFASSSATARAAKQLKKLSAT